MKFDASNQLEGFIFSISAVSKYLINSHWLHNHIDQLKSGENTMKYTQLHPFQREIMKKYIFSLKMKLNFVRAMSQIKLFPLISLIVIRRKCLSKY